MPNNQKSNRGLASADDRTRQQVSQQGGQAQHSQRGLQAADQQTRKRVAQAGGKASHGGRSSNR